MCEVTHIMPLNENIFVKDTPKTPDYGLTANEYDLMQYTGLKDKNGKEIYEGDIINAAFFDGISENPVTIDLKIVVTWIKEGAGFNIPYTKTDNWHYQYEIIGNIYENPGLLKRKR